MIRVIKSGIMTTVQDAGRWGYQAFGITVAGAMDMKAYKDSQYDKLAQSMRENLDMQMIYDIIGKKS